MKFRNSFSQTFAAGFFVDSWDGFFSPPWWYVGRFIHEYMKPMSSMDVMDPYRITRLTGHCMSQTSWTSWQATTWRRSFQWPLLHRTPSRCPPVLRRSCCHAFRKVSIEHVTDPQKRAKFIEDLSLEAKDSRSKSMKLSIWSDGKT